MLAIQEETTSSSLHEQVIEAIQFLHKRLTLISQPPNLHRPQNHQDHIKDDDKERGDPA